MPQLCAPTSLRSRPHGARGLVKRSPERNRRILPTRCRGLYACAHETESVRFECPTGAPRLRHTTCDGDALIALSRSALTAPTVRGKEL